MSERDFGREAIVLVEIDQDFCTHTYGEPPCTAVLGQTGPRKCFNTRATCQAPAAYDRGTLTLRFAKPQIDLPPEWGAIPSLSSVTSSPTQLNIGGASGSSGPLGQRATVTITFQDHPDADFKTDPYVSERPYNPLERGTFWSKWIARNPYYQNRPLRIREGYRGQSPEEMQTRTYIIDSVDGPDSNGRVRVRGVDVLRLADNDRAQAPALSRGELAADISESASSFQVIGATAAEYPAPGTVRIGDEVIRYNSVSGSGVLTFSGLTRGSDGTEADEHEAGDPVQLCLRYVEEDVWVVTRDLLVNYAEIDPALLDYDAWVAEGEVWLPQFDVSTLITEPTGVVDLLGELTEQCLYYVWWDERDQLVRLRALRPTTGEIRQINEHANILQNSQAVTVDPNQRVTQLWLYYDQRDPTQPLDREGNYRRVRVNLDAEAESANEYGEKRIKKVFARWLRTDAQVINVATRILTQYRDNPRYVTLRVDAKDRDLWTADVVELTSRLLVDDTGQPATRRFQVISAEEIQAGEVVQLDLQEFEFVGSAAFWMADDAPDYADATEEERELGAWWSDDNGYVGGEPSPYTWQ